MLEFDVMRMKCAWRAICLRRLLLVLAVKLSCQTRRLNAEDILKLPSQAPWRRSRMEPRHNSSQSCEFPRAQGPFRWWW